MNVSAAQLRWDFVGISASLLCLLHCLLFPLAASFLPVLGNVVSGEEITHQVLALTLVLPAAFASLKAYLRHRRLLPVLLIALGVGEVAWGAFLGHEQAGRGIEWSITVTGSLTLVLGHLLNHVFGRRLRGAHLVCCSY
ncbi:MAG: MerC domain-containing protein [Bacteroidota bacterium]